MARGRGQVTQRCFEYRGCACVQASRQAGAHIPHGHGLPAPGSCSPVLPLEDCLLPTEDGEDAVRRRVAGQRQIFHIITEAWWHMNCCNRQAAAACHGKQTCTQVAPTPSIARAMLQSWCRVQQTPGCSPHDAAEQALHDDEEQRALPVLHALLVIVQPVSSWWG